MSNQKYISLQNYFKRVALRFIPIAIVVLGGLYFVHKTEKSRQHAKHAKEAQEQIAVSVASVSRNLQTISRDLRYLSSDVEFKYALNDPLEAPVREELAEEWVSFSRFKRVYDKVRWIDHQGHEHLRINYARPDPIVVPKAQLQDKSDRYFFQETIRLNKGEVFVSPLDLNMERGKIEVPYKPTIRLGMVVYDSRGTKKGILLINYLAIDMLRSFARAFSTEKRSGWLVNQNGYWLWGPKAESEYGFMFGRDDLNMEKQYPDAWKRIQKSNKGQFTTAEGMWTFETIQPWIESERTRLDAGSKIAQIEFGTKELPYEWKAIHFTPSNAHAEDMAVFNMKIIGTSAFVLALFFVGIWFLVRAQLAEECLRCGLEGMVEEKTKEIKQAKQRLAQSNIQLEHKVVERTAELARVNEALLQLSRQDVMTGLANRMAANERLNQEFVRLKRTGVSYAVLMMDIDHFKHVNDTFGHAAGDEVLKQIAEIMKSTIRESDFVARFGGEEFIALLPDTGLEEAFHVGEKIRQAIEDKPDPKVGRVTISIGLAVASQEHADENEAIKQADYWLYMAKDTGRNKVMALNHG